MTEEWATFAITVLVLGITAAMGKLFVFKKCTHCSRSILRTARVCPHCKLEVL